MYILSKVLLFNNFEFSNQTNRKEINIDLNLYSIDVKLYSEK